jgi:hypothetical protein
VKINYFKLLYPRNMFLIAKGVGLGAEAVLMFRIALNLTYKESFKKTKAIFLDAINDAIARTSKP